MGYQITRVRQGGRVAQHGGQHQLVLGRFAKLPSTLEVGGDVGVTVCPIDGLDAEQVLERVEAVMVELAAPPRTPWKPWFPVIDYDRCTNCMQCLSFCLFDVYGVSADAKIQVQNQRTARPIAPPARESARKSRSCSRSTRRARSTARRSTAGRLAPRSDEGRHLSTSRRRHLFHASRSQRQGEIAVLQGRDDERVLEGTATLSGQIARANGYSGRGAGRSSLGGADSGEGRTGPARAAQALQRRPPIPISRQRVATLAPGRQR